ncbi:MAG: hypothetical protein L0177_15795 [Chloroflexi bacterium]|nr:hypothetical protein [Chloroflexota bacterium]
MAAPEITKETLKAIAALSGLTLADEKIDQLLPQVRQSAEAMAALDELDLEGVEPAIIFRAERG